MNQNSVVFFSATFKKEKKESVLDADHFSYCTYKLSLVFLKKAERLLQFQELLISFLGKR